jgi:hypothetical protein
MDDNKQYIDLIERYLSGEMLLEEAAQFEEKLRADKELLHLYNFRVKMKKVWNSAEEYESIKNIVSEVAKEENGLRKYSMKFLYVAASIALLIGIYFAIDRRGERYAHNKNASDTLLVVPQIKVPENKGNEFVYTQKLISPLDRTIDINSEIYFKWESGLSDSVNLRIFIKDREIRSEKVLLSDKKFTMPAMSLTAGEYTWSVDGIGGRGIFVIKD